MYVVLSQGMGGSHAVAIFTSRAKADAFLAAHKDLINPTIIEEPVTGKYEEGESVYVAQEYDKGPKDIHHYVGLYADVKHARKRAGNNGHVLTLVPDDRQVE